MGLNVVKSKTPVVEVHYKTYCQHRPRPEEFCMQDKKMSFPMRFIFVSYMVQCWTFMLCFKMICLAVERLFFMVHIVNAIVMLIA